MSTKIFCNTNQLKVIPPKKLTLIQKLKNKVRSFLGVPWVIVDNVLVIDNKNINKILFSSDIEFDGLGNVGISSDKHIVLQSGYTDKGFIHLNPKSKKPEYQQRIEFVKFNDYIVEEFGRIPENNRVLECEEVKDASTG